MDCDVAVLGGGPGGYTAAIRAAQLGAQGRLHRAGARARRHLPARRLHPDQGVGADRARAQGGRGDASRSSGSSVGEPRLDFGRGERLEGRRRQADDPAASPACSRRTASSGCKGTGRFTDANTIAVEGGEDVTFKSAIVATGSLSAAAADPGPRLARAASTRPACSPRTEVPRRLVVLGGGIIGCEFASIFARFGSRGDDRRDAADG